MRSGFSKVITLFGLLAVLGLLSSSAHLLQQRQGILKGKVGLVEGHCMPSKNSDGCKPKPVSAWLYLMSPSEKFDLSKLVDSVFSNEEGAFQLALAPDKYSVFTKYQSEISCERYDCTPQCICMPVVIVADSVSDINITINKASW